MSYFFQLTMSGLSIGLIYALIGMSLMLMLRAAHVMNFAQGSFVVLGAYTSYVLLKKLEIPYAPLRILIGIVFFALVAAVFYFTCIRPFDKPGRQMSGMVATMGASTVIVELCLIFGTAQTQSMAPIMKGTFKIGTFFLQYQYIFIFIISLIMMGLVYVFYDKLYCGRIMTAASQDDYAATLLGIPTTLTTLITMIICVVMTAVTGWLTAPIYLVTTAISNFQTRAFAGIIIGGFGTLGGAILGGILVGLIESYSTYLSSTYKDVIVYGVLLLMLLIRPSGILKNKTGSSIRA